MLTTPTDLKEFVSLTQAGKLAGVTPVTVRAWVDAGRVPGIRDPEGRRLVHRADLERVLRERANGGRSDEPQPADR